MPRESGKTLEIVKKSTSYTTMSESVAKKSRKRYRLSVEPGHAGTPLRSSFDRDTLDDTKLVEFIHGVLALSLEQYPQQTAAEFKILLLKTLLVRGTRSLSSSSDESASTARINESQRSSATSTTSLSSRTSAESSYDEDVKDVQEIKQATNKEASPHSAPQSSPTLFPPAFESLGEHRSSSDQLSPPDIVDDDITMMDSLSACATQTSNPAVTWLEEHFSGRIVSPAALEKVGIKHDSLSDSIDATSISDLEALLLEEDRCFSDQVQSPETIDNDTIMDDSFSADAPPISSHTIPEDSAHLLEASPAPDPSNFIMSVPKPEFPIRVYEGAPPPFSKEAQSRVMRWVHKRHHFTPNPEWLIEPDVQKIRETLRPHMNRLGYEAESAVVEEFSEGGFHKIFAITVRSLETSQPKQFIVRIPLPVLPYFKTESDVATTEMVRYSTKIPVPIIYAYDSSSNNPLGLEWVLMEKINGKPMEFYWDDMEYDSKLRFTKSMAEWSTQLSKITFNKIGSVYMHYTKSRLEFYVGRSTNHLLRQENRLLYNAYRGPFTSLQEYYASILAISTQDFNDHSYRNSAGLMRDARYSFLYRIWYWKPEITDEQIQKFQDDRERDINDLLNATAFLQKNLPALCEKLHAAEELSTRLSHHDLSLRNVLVDDAGTPLILLDWESCDFRPLMLLASWPDFIDGESISYEPERSKIPPENVFKYGEEDTREIEYRNEEVYQERLDIYTSQRLREEYRNELIRLESPLKEANWDGIDDEELALYWNISCPWDNDYFIWGENTLLNRVRTWAHTLIEDESDDEDEEEEDDESDKKEDELDGEEEEANENREEEENAVDEGAAEEVEDGDDAATVHLDRPVVGIGEEPKIDGR